LPMEPHEALRKKRSCRGFLLLVLLPFLFCLAVASGPVRTEWERITFRPAGVWVRAEKADSPQKRERGLMYRSRLAEKDAMMFYFDETVPQAFWMYHTQIPLTVIFLDDGLRIVDMQNMSPCLAKSPEQCPVYVSQGPARYAIEVNQGFVGKYGIKIGDRVTIESEN